MLFLRRLHNNTTVTITPTTIKNPAQASPIISYSLLLWLLPCGMLFTSLCEDADVVLVFAPAAAVVVSETDDLLIFAKQSDSRYGAKYHGAYKQTFSEGIKFSSVGQKSTNL